MSTTDPFKSKCDILMPIYNGLSYVVDAVESVLACTEQGTFHLCLVDDASDTHTAAYLDVLATENPSISVLRNRQNVGFVQSCIRAEASGDAPFVLLLNSDVVVTPGWLERLLACAETDTRIASVNPLTNHASQIALPMLPGATYRGMDDLLSRRAPRYPDVVTGVGFCMLLRRSALRQVGFFDEIFGRGYCEESDLCMRLTTNGHRTVVADNVYVYHRGSGSFGKQRGPQYLANRRIFDQRWAGEYKRQFAAFRTADPLREVRAMAPQRTCWDPMPVVWRTGRVVIDALKSVRPLVAARESIKGLLALPGARRPLPNAQSVAAVTRPGRLRVTYILHRMVVAGGVLSVIQIVNELIRRGVEVRIVTLFEDPCIHDWTRLYTRPVVFRNEQELIRRFPETDIVVATLWSTAPWAKAVLEAGRARVGVYFLQDYEPWFFPEHDSENRLRAQSTFSLLENRIVKSDWLAGMLRADGYATRKILIGMDLARFYPRDVPRSRPVLLAMARPRTPRRGFDAVIAALEKVKQARPEVDIVLFGDSDLKRYPISFDYRDEGVIADQDRMAEVYSEADVFLDGSEFQGFGRCGLEAMACGAACVLTSVGGVNEYARHAENALLVAPAQPDAFADAMVLLLENEQLRARLVAAGLNTVKRFCHRREAGETLGYFQSLLNRETEK